MNKKLVYRYLSYVLLLAVLCATIPVHQIFHKHSLSTASTAKAVSLKKYEKPCCKSFEGLYSAVYFQKSEIKLSQNSYGFLLFSFPGFIAKSIIQLTNKAPPVVIA